MLSLRTRRRAVYLVEVVAVVAVVYFLYQLFGSSDTQPTSNLNTEAGAFNWATRREQFPPEEIIKLPDPSRKSLPKIQHAFTSEAQSKAAERTKRQHEVQVHIKRAWKAYRKHAFPQDELAAVSGSARDTYGNWAVTLVGMLDTLWISGLRVEFQEAVGFVPAIDFTDTVQPELNLFEMSKILGGLLSAYDLSNDKRLLDKALSFATVLYAAYDTPNRFPSPLWDIHKARGRAKQFGPAALTPESAGLAVDFTRLAVITKNNKWYDAAIRVFRIFEYQQKSSKLPGFFAFVFPGFDWPNASLSEPSSVLYQSLPKMFALLRGSDYYKEMFKTAAEAIEQEALFRPMLPPHDEYNTADMRMPGAVYVYDKMPDLHPNVEHSACYAAGMFAYAGRLFRNETYIATARKLINGCLWASDVSPSGIMPNSFTVYACPSVTDCHWNFQVYHDDLVKRFTEEHSTTTITDPKKIIEQDRLIPGMTTITSRRYDLSSPLVESLFMMYRITGDPTYTEKAWKLFTNIMGRTKTGFANAALEDVTAASGAKEDIMPSAWTAETLKYFYLLFSDPETMSLDQWVFTASGHPYRLGRTDLR